MKLIYKIPRLCSSRVYFYLSSLNNSSEWTSPFLELNWSGFLYYYLHVHKHIHWLSIYFFSCYVFIFIVIRYLILNLHTHTHTPGRYDLPYKWFSNNWTLFWWFLKPGTGFDIKKEINYFLVAWGHLWRKKSRNIYYTYKYIISMNII